MVLDMLEGADSTLCAADWSMKSMKERRSAVEKMIMQMSASNQMSSLHCRRSRALATRLDFAPQLFVPAAVFRYNLVQNDPAVYTISSRSRKDCAA